MTQVDRVLRLANLFYRVAAAQPIVMYHGTSVSNLPSILSQGLDPSPKQRAWKEDPSAGWHSPSRASIGGIYLTTNLMTALSASYNPQLGHGAKNVSGVVIVETIPNVLVADEDDFTFLAGELAGLPNEWAASSIYMNWLLVGENGQAFQHARNEYVKHNMERIEYKATHSGFSGETTGKPLHPKMIERLRQILTDGFITALTRKVAYVDDYTWRRAWDGNKYNLPKEEQANIPSKPNPSEAERQYAAFADQLTRTVKTKLHPDIKQEFNYTARSLNPIGFDGSSKIVAVLVIDRNYDEGKRDEKGNRIFQIKVLYPESWSKVPEEAKNDFVKQWKERMGSQIEFV